MTITIILISIFIIDFWIEESQDIKFLQKARLVTLNTKPFNCGYCLSFWLGLVIALIMQDITLITLPIIYKFYSK